MVEKNDKAKNNQTEDVKAKDAEAENEEVKNEETTYGMIQGKFSYGGHSKNYGLFYLLLNDGPILTIEEFNLAINNQKNLDDINLNLAPKLFVDVLKEAKEMKEAKSHSLTLSLESNLDHQDLKEIKAAIAEDDLDEITSVFKEKLENEFQEQTKVQTIFISLGEKQTKKIFPELFKSQVDDSEGQSSSDNAENETEQKESGADLDSKSARITLKCSPVISPASGSKAESLTVGDSVSVKISDGSESAKRYKSELYGDKRLVEGEIKELLFNKESNRYSILLQLKDDIYGELIVGPQVKLASSRSDAKVAKDESDNNQDADYSQNLILLFALAGALLIVLIILIGFYLT